MNRTGTKHHMDGLLALLLFGVFAACVLSVLLTGAQVYSRLNQRDQAAYNQRTGLQYLATKVRQAGQGGLVRVEDFGGEEALVIAEEAEGELYLTRIYCHQGWLWELFSAGEDEFLPGDGEKLLAARDLKLELEDGLLRAELTDGAGQTVAITLALRGGEGGQP